MDKLFYLRFPNTNSDIQKETKIFYQLVGVSGNESV